MIVAAVGILLAVAVYAAEKSETGTRHDRGIAVRHHGHSKAAGVFAVARSNVVSGMTVWERKVIRFINRMVRMYENSPYSYENFQKTTDDLGKASRIK